MNVITSKTSIEATLSGVNVKNNNSQGNSDLKNEINRCKEKLGILGEMWLTDNIFTKYFEILSLKLLGNESKIMLMDPTICQGIKSLNDFSVFLDPLILHDKQLIIMPVNNYEELLLESNHQEKLLMVMENDCRGSHWSTLIFNKEKGDFYHYDSAGDINLPHSQIIAQKLAT